MAGVILRDLLLAAELLSIVSTLAIAWLWFDLARRRLDARVGALLVWFLATNAYFLRFGYSATTDAFTDRAPEPGVVGPAGRAHPARSPAHARTGGGRRRRGVPDAIYRRRAGTRRRAGHRAGRDRSAIACAGGRRVPARLLGSGRAVGALLAGAGGFSFQLHRNIAWCSRGRAASHGTSTPKTLQPQFPNLEAVIARDPAAVFPGA